ncbi:unnamed protein product, partial [Urochloa humidicola]
RLAIISCIALKGKRRQRERPRATKTTLSSTRQSKRPARDPEAAAMATVSAAAATSVVARAAIARPNALGLPQLRARSERVRCGYSKDGKNATPVSAKGAGASLLAAAGAVTASAGPALALVDERMSTEGTGLSLGLSNNLLGWILLGVFGLIWSLYTVYTSDLDEDEESGLSL